MSEMILSTKQNREIIGKQTHLLKVIYARLKDTMIWQFRKLVHNVVQRRQLLKRRFYNLQPRLLARLVGVDLLRHFGRRLLHNVFGV